MSVGIRRRAVVFMLRIEMSSSSQAAITDVAFFMDMETMGTGLQAR